MKRMKMETQIALTFLLTTILGVVVEGLFNVISNKGNFINYDIMALSLVWSLVYLFYIWIESRRHKLLALTGTLGIGLMFLFVAFSSEGVSGTFSGWHWVDTVRLIYYIAIYQLAEHQGKMLLEEDATMEINVIVEGNISSEGVDIPTD